MNLPMITRGRIHNTSFSSQLMNVPNKMECLLMVDFFSLVYICE